MKSTILRWRTYLALVAVLGIVNAPLGVSPAVAATTRTDFVNQNINCRILSQTMWVEGRILHISNRVMEGVVLSDGDYHAGTGHMVANANIDLVTGYGTFHGTLEIYPDAYPNGHWAGSWSLQNLPSGADGIARLQGYGELSGLSTMSELTPIFDLEDYAKLCGGPPISGAQAVGFVMDPGGE